jgi:hypothetical protein
MVSQYGKSHTLSRFNKVAYLPILERTQKPAPAPSSLQNQLTVLESDSHAGGNISHPPQRLYS